MPLALAVAGLGLTATGTGMSIAGNHQSQNAINAARRGYVQKQADLTRQNNTIAQKSIAGSSADVANQQIQAGANARTTAWDNLQKSTVPVASALPANGGTATGAAGARSVGAGNTWNNLNAKAAAKEGGYGDWENQQSIKNADVAQQLGINKNFAEGNARLFPTQMEVASQAGGPMSGWGQIVSSIGQVAGMASNIPGGGVAKAGVMGTSGIGTKSTGLAGTLAAGGVPAVNSAGIPSGWIGSSMPNWSNIYK